jgi:inositol-phosphate phosphatase/L-galactose 1-phosphate phosphatase/histidinol-phosphatase
MTVTGSRPGDFLPLANRLADAAAAVVRRYYRAPIAVEAKADASPVTIADREAEQAMRDLIRAEHPDHGIDGEEFPPERTDAEWVWHLDPIDGTKSFVTGRPLFGTLIGLARHGRPALGVIDQCILRERWVGAERVGSTWNGEPIRTRPCAALADAVMYTTSPEMFQSAREQAAFARVREGVHFAVYGGDCYAYGLLALGFADLVIEANNQVHDFLPLVPVIEGAGGVVTDWRGGSLTTASDGRILAAGDPRLHERVLERLAW